MKSAVIVRKNDCFVFYNSFDSDGRPHAANHNAIGTWSGQFKASILQQLLFSKLLHQSVHWLFVLVARHLHFTGGNLVSQEINYTARITMHLKEALVQALYPNKQRFGPISLFLPNNPIKWEWLSVGGSPQWPKIFCCCVSPAWSQDGVPHLTAWWLRPGGLHGHGIIGGVGHGLLPCCSGHQSPHLQRIYNKLGCYSIF